MTYINRILKINIKLINPHISPYCIITPSANKYDNTNNASNYQLLSNIANNVFELHNRQENRKKVHIQNLSTCNIDEQDANMWNNSFSNEIARLVQGIGADIQ